MLVDVVFRVSCQHGIGFLRQHRASYVGESGTADLRSGEAEAVAITQYRRNGAYNGEIDTIEDPGNAKPEQDETVNAAPRQAVEPSGNLCPYLAALGDLCCGAFFRKTGP